MSGTATIAITVGVAVAVLVGFFIVYYLGNVANSVYDVKVGVRKDFDKKVKELQDFVEKDTKQRLNWLREENKEEGKRLKTSMEDYQKELFDEMTKTIERLRADVTSLQVQVQNLSQGKTIAPHHQEMVSDNPYRARAQAHPRSATGDLDVPKTGIPDPEAAPDLDVPKKPATKADDTPVEDKPAESKPKAQPAPKEKKKKKRPTGEFEAFSSFNDDFKSGS